MENEKIENEERALVVEENQGIIKGLGEISSRSKTACEMFTNIKDKKKLFNLENGEEVTLLNDCEGEKIRVKGVIIKNFRKPLPADKIQYDEETGEIIKDSEVTMSCILVDDNEKAYATGSKMFTIQMMKYLEQFGFNPDEGLEIEICRKKMKDSNNKCLAFKLV